MKLENGDLLTSGPKELFIPWFCQRTKQSTVGWEKSSMLARVRDLRPLVVVIYNHFHHPDIWMHIAAEPHTLWCTPDFVYHCFYYPFVELGCGRVTALAPSRARHRKWLRKLGFIEEGCIRESLPTGDDQIVYGMLRRECRWLGETHEQARRTLAA
jgi:hypothetical protein